MKRWEEVKISEFSGPLDLLWILLKDKKLSINKIDVLDVVNQYIDYIKIQQNLDIEIASEYLVIASQLIEMKTKSLLPKDNLKNEEDVFEYDDLIDRLNKYDQIKSVTGFFEEQQNYYIKTFSKDKSKIKYTKNNIQEEIMEPLDFDLESFAKIFKKIIIDHETNNYQDELGFEEDYTPLISNQTISPKEVAQNIISKILTDKNKNWKLIELIDNNVTTKNIVVVFLSLLDLVRYQIITIIQKENLIEVNLSVQAMVDENIIFEYLSNKGEQENE